MPTTRSITAAETATYSRFGGGVQPLADNSAQRLTQLVTLASGGSTALDPTQGSFVNAKTAGGNTTVTVTPILPAGSQLFLQILNDATGARTITLSTGFRFTNASVVGTANRIMLLRFISDGTSYNEYSRTIAEV